MIGFALFKGRELILRFKMTTSGSTEKTSYSLGGALCDFTAVKPQISEKLFKVLGKKFLSDISARVDTPTMGAYIPFLRKALETNPYLFLYLKFYAEALILSCNGQDALIEFLRGFVSKEISEKHLDGIIALADEEQTANWLGQVIFEDFELRRNRTKTYLDKIVLGEGGLEDFTHPQRFFILKQESKGAIVDSFKVTLSSEHSFEATSNLGTVKSVLKGSDEGILSEYEINTPDDLISIELFQTVLEELPIKKCRCCGEYFVPVGRSDSEYCSRITMGEEKRCAQIGAMKTFKGKYAENPIYAEYNKAYKRNHSRLRNGKLYESEFREWSIAARKIRDEFIENEKSAEEFTEKLKELEVAE